MSAEPQDVRPLHILIPSELHSKLKELAAANRRSMAAETRVAIEARLDEFADRDSETSGAAA